MRKVGAVLFVFSSYVAQAADPTLFEQMEGCWRGNGKRTAGEKVYRITSLTWSRVVDGRLESRNRVRNETLNRSYEANYWIAPKEGSPYQFELGEVGSSQAQSIGFFVANARKFKVHQDLGNDRHVYSDTEFSPEGGQSVYGEQLFHRQTKLSETTVEYVRIDEAECFKKD